MIKTLVVSPLFTRSGYGEHGRFIINALNSRPDLFDLHAHPIHWGQSSWISANDPNIKLYESLVIKKELFQEEYDLIVLVTIPSEWETYSGEFPSKCKIGITAGIETDRIPVSWIEPANSMDHIIFTSKHSQSGFTKVKFKLKAEHSDDMIERIGISTPSEVIGYPVKSVKPLNLENKLSLDTDFNFLTISQISPRKGVEQLLHWFLEEFHDENVGLVAKIHHGNNSNFDREMLRQKLFKPLLKKYPDAKCKIHWIHGSMSEGEIHGLYVHPQIHAYITTTHGEGFGLPLFEAAYSGLPVCATSWSGHLDFLKMPRGLKKQDMYERIRCTIKEIGQPAVMDNILLPHMKWAHCDISATKKAMRNMVKVHKAKINIAKTLQGYLQETFSENNQFEKICNACAEVYEKKSDWQTGTENIRII
jgi:glycosyltransferase involved in cell wall biosynthesis